MLKVQDIARPGLAPTSFGLAAGECVAVMGPSGAGKSLLLRAVADLDPNRGEAWLDGSARSRMPAPGWRALVTYVAAESGWWADSVGAHFSDPDAAAALLPSVRLPADALGWPVARLSTGERQRLALVRALVRRPPVLLLDEPTAALDAGASAAVETLLRERLGQGVAILMATHDPDLASRLARRILRVEAGQVRWEVAA